MKLRQYCSILCLLSINLPINTDTITLDLKKLNQEFFSAIYRANIWGDSNSRSGPGSNFKRTEKIRAWLPEIFKKYGTKRLVDCACGDFFWSKEVDLSSIMYIGVDIVSDVIVENIKRYANDKRIFLHLDITADELPAADTVICRDCLPHLCFADIFAALKNFKKTGAQYLIISTYPDRTINHDLQGAHLVNLLRYRPLNFQYPPFNFPAPLAIINEANDEGGIEDKSLAIWAFKDLPI